MQSLASIPPLYEVDLNTMSLIDTIPEGDLECPSCMVIQANMLVCKSC